MKNAKKLLKNCYFEPLIRSSFIFFIRLYQIHFSAFLGGACRFDPSCSRYAEQALKTFSLKQAIPLIVKRVIRCRPFSTFGWDPIPTTDSNSKVT